DFARKAVIPDAGHGAFDPSFVAGMAYSGRIDVKVPGLCVLEKRGGDPRPEWIRVGDDGLGVVGDRDFENAAKEFPGCFTRLNRPHRGFLKRGIDESMA